MKSLIEWFEAVNKAALPLVHARMNPENEPVASVTETRTFLVPEENLQELQAKFARIIKRAKKLHLTPPNIAVDHTPEVRRYEWSVATERWNQLKGDKAPTPGARVKVRQYYSVVLTGEAPVLPGGWELAAVLTRVEGGNLIAATGKHETPKRFRDTDPVCDHCKLDRKRTETFLVTNKAGDWKQIGRNCIGDFLGANAMNRRRAKAAFVRRHGAGLQTREETPRCESREVLVDLLDGVWPRANPSSIANRLASIKILYRDRNLSLWGIPYLLRPGQSPRHLQEPDGRTMFEREERGAKNTHDWIWLGQDYNEDRYKAGPYHGGSITQHSPNLRSGHLDPSEQRVVSTWLKTVDAVPTHPSNWLVINVPLKANPAEDDAWLNQLAGRMQTLSRKKAAGKWGAPPEKPKKKPRRKGKK